jgi:predicted DNA-binding protein
MKNKEYQSLSLRLLPEQHETLRRLSFETRIPISELIRKAIEKEYMKKERRMQE